MCFFDSKFLLATCAGHNAVNKCYLASEDLVLRKFISSNIFTLAPSCSFGLPRICRTLMIPYSTVYLSLTWLPWTFFKQCIKQTSCSRRREYQQYSITFIGPMCDLLGRNWNKYVWIYVYMSNLICESGDYCSSRFLQSITEKCQIKLGIKKQWISQICCKAEMLPSKLTREECTSAPLRVISSTKNY